MSDWEQRTRQLAIDLTSIPSINGTPGEATVIEYLHHHLSQYSECIAGKIRLHLIPCDDDPQFRPLLIAHRPGRNRQAMLLFGHTDTVGASDYGALESLAFRPLELTERARQGVLGADAQRRAQAGWLFGRGLLDMKAGVAAALTAFLSLAQTDPQAHLFFAATPDEEVGSLGVKTLTRWLDNLFRAERLEPVAAINTDYTACNLDSPVQRALYLGSIGKLLPAVYVRGIPSHAAEPERGVDPNVMLAAITRAVVYQRSLCDDAQDQICPPPVCLSQRDDKPVYDVQTALSASAYYNLFHMTRSPAEQLRRFTNCVRTAVEQLVNDAAVPRMAQTQVFTYAQLYAQADAPLKQQLAAYSESLTLSRDLRERSRLLAEYLLAHVHPDGPAVVIYFANGLIPMVDSGESLQPDVAAVAEAFAREGGERFVIRRLFPYISDLSFLSHSADWDDDVFAANFPCQSTASPASVCRWPTLMIGTCGAGAHQPDESVDAAYTFGRLPVLLHRLTVHLLAKRR